MWTEIIQKVEIMLGSIAIVKNQILMDIKFFNHLCLCCFSGDVLTPNVQICWPFH